MLTQKATRHQEHLHDKFRLDLDLLVQTCLTVISVQVDKEPVNKTGLIVK